MRVSRLAILVLIFLSGYALTGFQHVQAGYTVSNCNLPECVLVGMTGVPNFLFLAPKAVQTGSPQDFEVRPAAVILFYNNDTSYHTTTSGTGVNDPQSGKVFDSRLMKPGDVFQWQVPAGFTGIQPYYCIPHVVDDMKGSITVRGQPISELSVGGFTILTGILIATGLFLVRAKVSRKRDHP